MHTLLHLEFRLKLKNSLTPSKYLSFDDIRSTLINVEKYLGRKDQEHEQDHVPSNRSNRSSRHTSRPTSLDWQDPRRNGQYFDGTPGATQGNNMGNARNRGVNGGIINGMGMSMGLDGNTNSQAVFQLQAEVRTSHSPFLQQ